MIDIKFLRENPESVRVAIRKKKFECNLDEILDMDRKRRAAIADTEKLRSEQKAANAEMANLAKDSETFRQKVEEMRALSTKLKAGQAKLQEIEATWREKFLTIPNIPHNSVPEGDDEKDNEVVRTWGEPASVSTTALAHYDIPGFEKHVDLKSGTKVTGSGFPYFVGEMARLVRSLIQFYLDEANKAGYREMMTPLLVNEASATATGHLPDKEGQMYELANERFFLIPTAEVSITNYLRDEIVDHSALPISFCGYTPCFRREAGSYGKEVRGLNRTHQFDKVELVKWVHPDSSYEELDAMLGHVEALLQKLELPYRLLLMCSGEIGFPHAKQFDIEVWAAGQGRWLEVSSCSNFTDFQARRANTRFRSEEGKLRHMHTLNGSALAIPRVLAAILENNIEGENRIRIPECLTEIFGKDTLEL